MAQETTTDAGTTSPLTQEIDELLGTYAAGKFEMVEETYKEQLADWAKALAHMGDRVFRSEAVAAIHASSQVTSYRGNWEHLHFKAYACYAESERRKAAKHEKTCKVTSLYDMAFNTVARQQDADTLVATLHPCTCAPKASPAPSEAERN